MTTPMPKPVRWRPSRILRSSGSTYSWASERCSQLWAAGLWDAAGRHSNGWRDAPGFFQRFTGTFRDDDNSITGRWERSRDGSNWEIDFDMT